MKYIVKICIHREGFYPDIFANAFFAIASFNINTRTAIRKSMTCTNRISSI